MKDEISAAVVFITKIVRKSKHLNSEDVTAFSEQLARVLMSRFRNHWYEDKPSKGQGYRCIRISIDEPRDSVLVKAAEASGVTYNSLNLPVEMTLWVDPREVTCRFGEMGTCCTIASFTSTDSSSDEESVVVDTNGNNGNVRIPSPNTLLEQQEGKLRNQKRQNNFHNDLYNSSQYSSNYASPRLRRQNPDPFRWVNNGTVAVRS